MPGKNQTYGRDYLTITIAVQTEAHKALRIKAAEYGVTISDVARAGLADDSLWRRVAKIKAQERKAKG